MLEAGQQALKHHDTTTGDPRARTADQRRAHTLAHLAWTALTHARITPSPTTTNTAADAADANAAADAARANAGAV